MLSKRVRHVIFFGVLIISSLLCFRQPGFAYNALQLDISDGVYDEVTQTTVATGSGFVLYALLNPQKASITDTYYISMAISPKVDSPAALGSFSFRDMALDVTTVYDVTGNMTYGTPPIEALEAFESGDLPPHGMFPTYFAEYSFTFDSSHKADAYDVQEYHRDPSHLGGFTPNSDGEFYYAAFELNTLGMAADYVVHFDLYNEKVARKDATDIDVDDFAPFSHDAESHPNPVPEPSTMLLLSSGLGGLFTLKSLRKRKINREKADK